MRKRHETLRGSLETERSSFIGHWRDLANYIQPRRALFESSDTNRGEKKNTNIINSTASQSVRILQAGMMSGITSPARPWFKLTTTDQDLSELPAVKEWLHTVSQRISASFIRSNLYNALPLVYGDIGTFATAGMLVEEDFDSVIRCYVFPIGSYMLANDEKGRPRVFFREFRLTVRQVVEKFGIKENDKITFENLSQHVKDLYESKSLDEWIDVCHVIYANTDYDPNALYSNKKRYRSIYYEKGSTNVAQANYVDGADDKYLSDKGYDYFPVLAPRWEVTGEDVYGTNCPGMLALGDIKAMQTMEKRSAQAIEHNIKPSMIGPAQMKVVASSLLPGDVTYYDEREGQKGFRPTHEVRLGIQDIEAKIEKHEDRIKKAFFENLFLMLDMMDRGQITATEVMERKQEKMMALGTVLEQLNQDLLDPLIDIAFDIHVNQGLIPEPPEELAGMALKVEYVSIMHQAQKASGLGALEQTAGFVGRIAEVVPDALDKIDVDQLIDEYGEITGVPPRIIRSDEDVMVLRENRRAMQERQAQMEAMAQGAQTAKDLSATDLGSNNALNALIQQSEAGAPV